MRPPAPPILVVDDTVIRTLELHGAPPDVIAQARAHAGASTPVTEPDVCEIWPENLRSFNCFMSVATQWERSDMTGQIKRLIYPAVWSVLDGAHPRRHRRQLFADLQTMERAVIEADAERVAATSPAASD